MDPIAELGMLQPGTHVSVACQTQPTDCTLNLGWRCTPASEADQRVAYNSFVESDMDSESVSAVRSIGIESV